MYMYVHVHYMQWTYSTGSHVTLTCHGGSTSVAQLATADERGGQFVRVLQPPQGSCRPGEVIHVRKPILVVGDVSHQSCGGTMHGQFLDWTDASYKGQSNKEREWRLLELQEVKDRQSAIAKFLFTKHWQTEIVRAARSERQAIRNCQVSLY